MRAEAKAAFLCLVGALLWFLPWLAPGKALLGTHPALYRPIDEATPPALLAEVKAAARPMYGDKVIQHDPEVRFTLGGGSAGEVGSAGDSRLPAWNPDVLGGVPHVATGLSSALHPLMWISWLIAPPRCYAWIALLQTALAGWFAFLLLRAFEVAPLAAGGGALLFAGSGWMSVHQEYFQLTAAATWLPLALFGAKRLLDGRGGGAVALGVAVACSFLSGFPQIAVYGLLAVALLFVATLAGRLVRRQESARGAARSALAVALPTLLGLGIASPQILSTLEFVPHATRRPFTVEEQSQQALPPLALAGALTADLFSRSLTQAQIDDELALAAKERRTPRLQTLFELALPTDERARLNRFEITFALGPAALLFTLLGLAWGRSGARALFGLLLAVGLVLVLPGPLLRASAHVPGLDVGDPKRVLLLVELALVGLAALGIEKATADARTRRRALWLLGGGAALSCLAAALCLAPWNDLLRGWLVPRIARARGLDLDVVAGALTSAWLDEGRALLRREALLAAAFTAAAFLALLPGVKRRGATGAALIGALALPLAWTWRATTSPIPTAGLEARPPLLDHFARHPPKGRVLRVGGVRGEIPPWPPKLPMLLNVRDAQGYVAAYLKEWRDLFEAVDPGSTESVAIWPLSRPEQLALPIFDLLDVEYAIVLLPKGAAPPAVEGWEVVPLAAGPTSDRSDRIVLWRNAQSLGRAHVVRRLEIAATPEEVVMRLADPAFRPAEEAWMTREEAAPLLARADWPPPKDAAASRVELVSESAEELAFKVSGGGGLLVESDCWYPGWTVRVDGAPVALLRVDHALRGVVVPPGDHQVRFRYVSGPLTLGWFVAAASMIGLVAASRRLGRSRKST